MNPAGLYHPPPYPVMAAVAGVLALLALWRFLAHLRRDRLVADTPAARLRSAAQGYVKVSGRTAPAAEAATAAPLTSRPCVWWAYTIAHQERDSRGNSRWEIVDSGTSVEPFALVDDDGARCLVGPVQAEVTPTVHNVWYGTRARPEGPPTDSIPLLHEGSYRYTERLLGVGARLCVLGQLRSSSESGDASAAAAAKLHEWKQDQRALLARFDLDRDGRLSDAEWGAARAAAAREAEGETLKASIERVSVISQPMNGEPFLIAPLTSQGIERRERRFAALYFALGLVCVAACAWAIRHA
jgi:E3 ubiquitin ligase